MRVIQVWIGEFKDLNSPTVKEDRLVVTEKNKETFKRRQEDVVGRFTEAGYCLIREHWINRYIYETEGTA